MRQLSINCNHILEKKNLQCLYIDRDAFVLSITSNDINKDLINLEDIFDVSNLNEKQELFSNKNKTNYWNVQDRNA